MAFLPLASGLTAAMALSATRRLDLFDEPLRGEARLDHRLAAVAVAHVVGVVLDAAKEPLLFEVMDDLLASDIAVEARVGAAFGVDVRGRPSR